MSVGTKRDFGHFRSSKQRADGCDFLLVFYRSTCSRCQVISGTVIPDNNKNNNATGEFVEPLSLYDAVKK